MSNQSPDRLIIDQNNNQLSTTIAAGKLYSQHELPDIPKNLAQKSNSMLGYMEAKHSPAIQNLFSSSKKQTDTKMTAAATGSAQRKGNSRNKRKFSVDPNSALTNMNNGNGGTQAKE